MAAHHHERYLLDLIEETRDRLRLIRETVQEQEQFIMATLASIQTIITTLAADVATLTDKLAAAKVQDAADLAAIEASLTPVADKLATLAAPDSPTP